MSFVNLGSLGDTYTVQANDDLDTIGTKFGMTAQQIADLNDLGDAYKADITIGQVLQMPYGVVTAAQIESQTPAQQITSALAPASAAVQNMVKTLTPKALSTQPGVAATAGKRIAVAASSGITMSTVLMGGAAIALTAALILIIKKRKEGA